MNAGLWPLSQLTLDLSFASSPRRWFPCQLLCLLPGRPLMRWPPGPSALLWTPSGWARHRCLCFLRVGLDSPPPAGPGPPPRAGALPRPLPPGARAFIPKTDRSRLQEHAFSSPGRGPGARGTGAFSGLDLSHPLGTGGVPQPPGLEMESRPGRLRGTVEFGGELRCFGSSGQDTC